MKNIDMLKQLKKEMATQIKETRYQYKLAQKTNVYNVYIELLRKLLGLQFEYRHHHIAYCELRGKDRKQIENKNRKYNEPSEAYIKQIKEKFAWTQEEIDIYNERKNNEKAICVNS